MSLTQKYQALVDAVKAKAKGEVKVNEQDNVLYIDAPVASEQEKDSLWNIYNQIDPDYRAGDLRLNLTVDGSGMQEYEVKPGDSLSKIGARYGVSW